MQEIDSFDPYKIIEQEQQAAAESPAPVQPAAPAEPADDEPFDPYEIIERDLIRPGAKALDGDAMKAAESRKIAYTLGTTRTAVDLDFDNMKSLAKTKQLQESLAAAPSSSRWLRDNVYDAPAFQDDTPLMERVESGLKEIGSSIADGFADIPKGFEAGLLVAEQGGAWADLGENKPSEDFLAEDKKRDERMKALQGDEPGMLWHAAQVLGTMAGSVEQGVAGGGAAAALATGAMATGAIPVAGQAFAAAGAVGTMVYGTYRIEGGLSVKENYQNTQDYDKARLIGNGVGFMNALVESIGLHVLGKAAKPVLDPLIAKFSPKAVTALENLTVQQALIGAAKSITLGTGQEVLTEIAQEVNAIAGEELAKAWSGIDSDLTAEAFIDRLYEVAIGTAQAMIVLGGISAGPVLHANLKKVNRAKENKQKLEGVIDRFKQMKAAQTSPEAAEELLDAQATDAGVSQVWVDAQALQQAMINAGVTKQDLEQVLPEAASQIDEAAAVGGDVVLPTARYASALGGTELGTVLNDHIRFERNGLSNAEALQVEQSLKQMRVDLINEQIAPNAQEQQEIDAIQNDPTKTPEQKTAEITARAERRKADNEARRAYEDRIVAQMEGANFTSYQARAQAKLAGSIVSNLARRLGVPVQEAVDRYGVNVSVSGTSPSGNKFNMPITQGKEWHMGPTNLPPETNVEIISFDRRVLTRDEVSQERANIDSIFQSGVVNDDTGFLLQAGPDDTSKWFQTKRNAWFINTVGGNGLARLVKSARLMESHADVAHKNPDVQGIHRLVNAARVGDQTMRVELTVRDYAIKNQERTVIRLIDSFDVEVVDSGAASTSRIDDARVEEALPLESQKPPSAARSAQPRGLQEEAPLVISLSRLLMGKFPYLRIDQKGYFDPVDENQYAEGGVYYESPKFKQTAWHGSPYRFDRFSTDSIGTGTGNATHGWGLYFTNEREIAQKYRDMTGPDGRVYEVDIPEDSAMLDSNADYSDQPQEVRDAINRLYEEEYDTEAPPDWWTGREVYQDIILKEEGIFDPDDIPGDYEMDMDMDELAGNSRLASVKLNSIGVKGVKFEGDDGDTGFVVFDDKAIRIIDTFARQSEGEFRQIAWHGTPYVFDKFTLDHVGSGVGAQWRGWGLYFALNRHAAESYMDSLVSKNLSPKDAQRYKSLTAYRNSLRGDLQQATDTRRQDEIQSNLDDVERQINELGANARVYQVDIPNDDVMVRSSSKFEDQPEAVKAAFERLLPGEELTGVTGLRAYRKLQKKLGSARAASESLAQEGVDGLRYRDSRDGECAVVWTEEAISIRDYLQRAPQDDGVLGSYSPADNRITLTPSADLSTFSHEIGHWYMETLIDVVRQGNAPASVVEDVQALFKEFGVADVAAWDALGFEGQRKYHERFASWTEQYLAQAKAPVGLKRFFMNLGRWIRDVYRDFTGGVTEATRARYRQEIGEELPELSDEVHQVLDRMVASERVVEEAQAAESLHPLFDSKPADMSDAEWDEFMRARALASEEGMSELVERQAKDDKWYANRRAAVMREKNQEAKAFRAGIREKVERRLNGRKEYVARDILSSGGSKFGLDNLKIDPESVRALGFADRTVAKLQTMGVLKKGGLTVEQARELLRPMARFSSDKQLIRGLLDTENRESIIEDQTTKICLARRSDLFNPADLDRAITAALHTEVRARVVATELKYLTGDAGQNARVLTEAARRAAIEMLENYPARAFTARAMMTLESRASRKAYRAIVSGDRAGAAIFKRQQLIYHEAARLAVALDKKKAKFVELRGRVFSADKKLAKTYDVNVLAIARAILANRGYGQRRAGEMVDPQKYLKNVSEYDPDLVIGLQAYLDRHPFTASDVPAGSESAANLVRMVEDLEALVKLARDLKTSRLNGQTKKIEEAVDELTQHVWGERFHHETREAPKLRELWNRGLFTAKAYLRRVENWCNTMDHGSSRGPFTQYIFKPIVDAATKYREKNREFQKRLVDILEARRAEWDNIRDIEAEEIGYTFRRKSELIAAILHTGNDSNKRKLLLAGRGPDDEGVEHPWADVRITETQEEVVDTSRWDTFIQRCYAEGIVTKEDMDTVQAIWDLLEEIKPMTQRSFKEYYGYYFEEIPARAIETPFGIYRGGYVPAAGEPTAIGQSVNKQSEKDLFNQASDFLDQMPVKQPGSTKARTGVLRPLSLNLGFLGSHIQTTLKFAMMAPTVKQVQRIITNREFKKTISEIDPFAIDDMLVPWLNRATNQSVSNPMRGGWMINYVRSTAGVALMAGNITNALQQLTGLSTAMSLVSAKSMIRGLSVFITHPARSIEAMKAASPFMKARLENFEFEFQNQIETIASTRRPTKATAIRNWTMRHAYFMQTWMQLIVDTPTWLAAYDNAMSRGLLESEAVFEADSVVRRTQSSFDAESVSRIETGNALERAILVFYSYFNMQLNLLSDSWTKNIRSGARRYGQFFIDFSLVLAIPAVLSEILVQAFGGFDTGDDDDWGLFDAMKLLLSPVVKNSLALVPFAGQAGNVLATRLAATGDGEEGFWQIVLAPNSYNDRLMSVPAFSLIENSFKAAGQLTDLMMGEDVNARATARNTLDAASLLTGIPFSALKRPLGYAAGVASGQIDPDTPVDVARGVITGRDTNAQ